MTERQTKYEELRGAWRYIFGGGRPPRAALWAFYAATRETGIGAQAWIKHTYLA